MVYFREKNQSRNGWWLGVPQWLRKPPYVADLLLFVLWRIFKIFAERREGNCCNPTVGIWSWLRNVENGLKRAIIELPKQKTKQIQKKWIKSFWKFWWIPFLSIPGLSEKKAPAFFPPKLPVEDISHFQTNPKINSGRTYPNDIPLTSRHPQPTGRRVTMALAVIASFKSAPRDLASSKKAKHSLEATRHNHDFPRRIWRMTRIFSLFAVELVQSWEFEPYSMGTSPLYENCRVYCEETPQFLEPWVFEARNYIEWNEIHWGCNLYMVKQAF